MQKWQVPVTVACLLTGMFAVNAFRTQSAYENSTKAPDKNKNLVGIIQYIEKETKSMEANIKSIRIEMDNIQKTQANGSKNISNLQKEIEKNKLTAGLTDISAPGIIISLNDDKAGYEAAAKNAKLSEYDAESFIVHDKNILYLVATLRNSGAQAISVNDQRIITSSNIRCVGPTIMVNSTRLAPPYTIKAMGNPDQLLQAVQKSDEYVFIQSKNLPIQVTKQPLLTIYAYNGPLQFSYAQITKEGAK